MCVTIMRAEAGRAPDDRGLQNLVGELSTRSETLRALWGSHDVRTHGTGTKRFHHPDLGNPSESLLGLFHCRWKPWFCRRRRSPSRRRDLFPAYAGHPRTRPPASALAPSREPTTVLTLLGSADPVQRSATVLEEHGLTGDVRIWQSKRQRLLMELAAMDRSDDAQLRTSQAAVHALAKAGIDAHSGSASPARHLAAGKVIELSLGTA